MSPQVRKGTYVLFLRFSSPFEGEVGSLGTVRLEPGEYCYIGSAMGGLDQRLRRHLSKEKRIRWHIDRLTLAAESMEAYESYPDPVPECTLARMAEDSGCTPASDGFGCSDCSCRTHLFSVDPGSKSELIKRASICQYSE